MSGIAVNLLNFYDWSGRLKVIWSDAILKPIGIWSIALPSSFAWHIIMILCCPLMWLAVEILWVSDLRKSTDINNCRKWLTFTCQFAFAFYNRVTCWVWVCWMLWRQKRTSYRECYSTWLRSVWLLYQQNERKWNPEVHIICKADWVQGVCDSKWGGVPYQCHGP